jgi:hypothetical protein
MELTRNTNAQSKHTFGRRIKCFNGEVAVVFFNRFYFNNNLLQTSAVYEMLAEFVWNSSILENRGDTYVKV